jgi:hypothetical protein
MYECMFLTCTKLYRVCMLPFVYSRYSLSPLHPWLRMQFWSSGPEQLVPWDELLEDRTVSCGIQVLCNGAGKSHMRMTHSVCVCLGEGRRECWRRAGHTFGLVGEWAAWLAGWGSEIQVVTTHIAASVMRIELSSSQLCATVWIYWTSQLRQT